MIFNKGLIFSRDVFIRCKQYGERGFGAVNLHTSSIKHLTLSFLPKYSMAAFAKSSILYLKTQTILRAKRKVAHTKITKKTSAMKVVFNEGDGKI